MMFLSKRKGKNIGFFGRVLVYLQFITVLPILLLIARISMVINQFAMHFIGKVPTMKWQNVHENVLYRICDFISIALHLLWIAIAFYYIPSQHRLLCFLIFHFITGIEFLVLTLNHFDRPTLHSSEEYNNWLIKQVITGRNIDVTFLNEWFFGGLHFQIGNFLIINLKNIIYFQD
jgi:hypothetical protein